MSTKTPMQKLFETLDKSGYPSLYAEPDEDMPIEQIFVALDQDEKAPAKEDEDDEAAYRYVLQFYFMEDALEAEPELEVEGLEHSTTLQILMDIPVSFEGLSAERALEGWKLLNIFTQILPVGNFGLSNDKMVFFRYGMMAKDKASHNPSVIIDLIDMLDLYLPVMIESLEALATTDQDIKDILAETGLNTFFEVS